MTDDEIRELFGEAPYFVDQVIEQYVPLDETAQKFVVSSYWSDQASVNLGDVCGTMHPDYAGMTWREFLSKGRRMAGNQDAFRRNPGYYTDAFIKRVPSMHFIRRDGKTFVGEDGNHRTCIGKLYFYNSGNVYIHQVTLIEQTVDWRFYTLYQRLAAVRPDSWRIDIRRENNRREDGPGWKRDFYDIRIAISDLNHKDHSRTDRWDCAELAEKLPKLEMSAKKPAAKGFFGRLFK